MVTGGDAAVALKDSKGAQALLTWLASADAAKIWAEAGGFISPNKGLDLKAYPNEVQRTMAQALIDAGDDVRFDMSDQAPQSPRRDARGGRVEDPPGFSEEPEGHRGDPERAGVRSGQGVQELTP